MHCAIEYPYRCQSAVRRCSQGKGWYLLIALRNRISILLSVGSQNMQSFSFTPCRPFKQNRTRAWRTSLLLRWHVQIRRHGSRRHNTDLHNNNCNTKLKGQDPQSNPQQIENWRSKSSMPCRLLMHTLCYWTENLSYLQVLYQVCLVQENSACAQSRQSRSCNEHISLRAPRSVLEI